MWPPFRTIRRSSSSHASARSVMWVKTEVQYAKSKYPSANGRCGAVVTVAKFIGVRFCRHQAMCAELMSTPQSSESSLRGKNRSMRPPPQPKSNTVESSSRPTPAPSTVFTIASASRCPLAR